MTELAINDGHFASAMNLETVKRVYRQAIDPKALDAEGVAWWSEVAAEVKAVVHAQDALSSGQVIAWWHNDWSMVGDTALRAARRIRSAAVRVATTHLKINARRWPREEELTD